jgi:hypothetical protein
MQILDEKSELAGWSDRLCTPPHSVRQRVVSPLGPWYKRAWKEIRTYVLENRERWIELCAQAAEELDSVKLLALTQEITRLLEEKAQRLRQHPEHCARLSNPKRTTAF